MPIEPHENETMAPYKENKNDSFIKRYFKAFRFYLITGLMVWIPLIVTVWLTWWLFKNVALGIEGIFENAVERLNAIGEDEDASERLKILATLKYRRGLGFGLAVVLFLSTGLIARNLIGQRIIRSLERLLSRVPGVNRIYKAVRQIRDVVVGRDGAVFQKVCVVQYPRKGVYVVAFVTSEEQGVVQITTGKNLSAVFVPTTPNPTSGFLLYLPPEEITVMDIPVEEAMKLIISGGAYQPGQYEEEEEPPRRKWSRRKSDKARDSDTAQDAAS
jgi:uncharacterized membrane protein